MVVYWRFSAIIAAAAAHAASLVSGLPCTKHERAETPLPLSPIVSATWLASNLNLESRNDNLVIIDIRPSAQYTAGHVPSSINIPFQGTPFFSSNDGNQTLVFPPAEVVSQTLGLYGIDLTTTQIVIVPDSAVLPSHMAMATRAAATFRYAGILRGNIAILDGGYPAWVSLSTTPSISTTTPSTRQPKDFVPSGKTDSSFIVDREYVRSRIGKAATDGIILLDARTEADFNAGHIPSALSLPAGEIWLSGGIWKDKSELERLFNKVVEEYKDNVGRNKGVVVVYCRTGMLATTWFYALSNVLGFQNVKLYDGSMEDWTRHGEVVSMG